MRSNGCSLRWSTVESFHSHCQTQLYCSLQRTGRKISKKERREQKGRGGGQIRREKTVLCEDKYPKEDVRPIADDVVHGDSTASME